MMIEINPSLISEIRILLIAEKSEFLPERTIINELICPDLRKYFADEFNIDFNLIDVHQETCCKKLPKVETSKFLISEIQNCQAISNGLSALFLIGDCYGQLEAPKTLTEEQFNHVTSYLQSRNDPFSITFNMKYQKRDNSSEYCLNENIPEDEHYSILNGIDSAISYDQGPFSESFNEEFYHSTLEKCLNLVMSSTQSISSTQIFHRSVIDTNSTKVSNDDVELPILTKISERFKNMKQMIKEKFKHGSYTAYSVSTTAAKGATDEMKNCPEKVFKILEDCCFLPNKCRLLAKDLRLRSSFDLYLQIFTENMMKIIRESCQSIFMKRKFSKTLLMKEIDSHKMKKMELKDHHFMDNIHQERRNEIDILDKYLYTSLGKHPCLIHGPIGSGKTALLLKLCEKIERSPSITLIIRFCGRTSESNSLHPILASISQQIHLHLFKSENQFQSSDYTDCVNEFWLHLKRFSPSKPIFILFDDVDRLFPSSETDKIKWLPRYLPEGVKVVLTTFSELFHQEFKRRYEEPEIVNIETIEIKEPLELLGLIKEQKEGKLISEKLLEQVRLVLQENCTPLFFSLFISNLHSLENVDIIANDIKSIFKAHIRDLESTYSLVFIHVFSYLSICRFGLSLSELVGILSLDNKLIASLEPDIQSPRAFQFPIFVLENLLQNCQHFLEYVQTNRRLLIRLRHQVYSTIIVEHYHLFQEEGEYFFHNLYEYWTSVYEKDKSKPFSLGASDETQCLIKRNVLAQPYYTINKSRDVCCNERKILELPFLFVTFNKFPELYRYVLFNFEYLFSTLKYFGIIHLISELDYCHQVNDIQTQPEFDLLLLQLRLLPNEVIKDARILSTELTGRLAHKIESDSFLSYLHQTIDAMAPKINVILSVIPSCEIISFENINLKINDKTPIILSASSSDNESISTVHFQKPTNELMITVWSSKSATKVQIVNLGTMNIVKFMFGTYVPQRHDLLILGIEDSSNKRLLIINLEYVSIEGSLTFPKRASIKLNHISKFFINILVDNERQIIPIQSMKWDHLLSKLRWPIILTSDERYLISLKPKTKDDNSEKKLNFNLIVMSGGTEDVMCELFLNNPAEFVLPSSTNKDLFVSTSLHGIIYRYDLEKITETNVKELKHSFHLKLSEQSLDNKSQELLRKYGSKIKANRLELSKDETFLLAEYILSDSIRIGSVWHLGTKSIVFCNQVSYSAELSLSADGQYFCCFVKNKPLEIRNLENGTCYSFNLDNPPNHVFMLKSGNVFMTYSHTIKLTSLDGLKFLCKTSNDAVLLPETYQLALPKPKIMADNAVIMSNDENSTNFLFYKLKNNSISKLDLSHSDRSLASFPSDRLLTPNCDKLLLVYNLLLHETNHELQRKEHEYYIMKQHSNGLIISNNNNYRKPQIPKQDYFLGTSPDKNGDLPPFNQKIIKMINIHNLESIFQISLIGEDILLLTNNVLLTFKSDYASLTRVSDQACDVINIYDINEAKFVSSLYIEHSVIDSILFDKNQEKLLISCGKNGQIIKIIGEKYFTKTFLNFDIQVLLKHYDEFIRPCAVTKLFAFNENQEAILAQYSWLETNSNTTKSDKEIKYAKVDVVNKEIICLFSTFGKIADVSNDGSVAIDSLLNVYELAKGSRIRKIQNVTELNSDTGVSDFISLFSNDAKHIIILDGNKGNMWVILNNNQNLCVGRALITSSNNNNNTSGGPYRMCLGLHGQVIIVYNNLEFKIFAMQMNVKPIDTETAYKSNDDRIKKLLFSK